VILFNHLICERNQPRWNGESERFGGLKIDHEFVFGRLKNWQIGWLRAFEDLPDVGARVSVGIFDVGSIADQTFIEDLRVKPRDPPSVWGYVTCAALGVMGMASRASLRWLDIRRFRSNCNPNRRLGIDDLGGALFGIGNRNHHDRKSLFDLSPGSCRRFFGVERSFDLSVHFQEKPFIDGPRLTFWRA
jgi:hypothetical protein